MNGDHHRGTIGARALVLCAALACASCDSGAGGSPAGDQPKGDGSEPLYVMTSNVWGTDGATGYLYTVRSLAEGAAGLEDAIEFSGGAWLAGRDGDRYVYVSSGDGGPTITRWEVQQDGALREGPTISFQKLGLTRGMRFGTALMLSDTKAYLVDSEQYRIATWNPKEMTVGELIELDVEPRDGLPAWLPEAVLREDRLFVTVAWEEDWRYASSTRLVAIDTSSDSIVEDVEETRCEQLAIGTRASDGTMYFTPYAHSPVARLALGPAYGTRSCALRIVPPGVSFEQGWDVDLSELAGGRPAGEFVLANDRVGFFRAFYDDEVGVTAENWTDKQGTPGYRWWRWEIGADHAEEIADQQLSVEAAHYVVGGKTYVGNPSADWSSTTIVELDPEGRLLEGLTVQGTPGGILQAL